MSDWSLVYNYKCLIGPEVYNYKYLIGPEVYNYKCLIGPGVYNYKCLIGPEVTLASGRDVNIQELTLDESVTWNCFPRRKTLYFCEGEQHLSSAVPTSVKGNSICHQLFPREALCGSSFPLGGRLGRGTSRSTAARAGIAAAR